MGPTCWGLLGLVFALVGGCTKPNPAFCCSTLEQCNAEGVSELRPCKDDLTCHDNQCVEPASDASPDTINVDAVIDAQGVHVFDVAYPKEWRFAVDSTESGYFLIVNTGTTELDTSTLQLKSLADDHSTTVLVGVTPEAIQIPPGQAAGFLTTAATNVLIHSNIVSEPRFNTTANFLTLGLVDHPKGNYEINVEVVVTLGDVDIPLSMLIHVIDTDITYRDPLIGHRAPVFAY